MRAFWVIVLALATWLLAGGLASSQDITGWSEPQRLSDELELASRPAVAADVAGNVHVIWAQRATTGEPAALFYTRWDGQRWSPPRDVLMSPGGANATDPDLAVTADGTLHAIWSTNSAGGTLLYSQAAACCADGAHNWSPPAALVPGNLGTGSLVADRQGRLHAVTAAGNADRIVYLRSDDGGATWPVTREVPGSSTMDEDYPVYPRLAVDERERIHLVWTIQAFPGRAVMYARSDDGGDTWGEPVEIDNATQPDYKTGYGPVFIDVEAHGEDKVHLIWDGAPTVERNHIWSSDGGNTWSAPGLLFPEITDVGRAGWNDMVFDSAGVLHVVALSGPLHASWWNGGWSRSTAIAQQSKSEWVRVAQGLGNQLHVVWQNYVNEQDYTVWYAKGVTSAPVVTPQPLPVPTAAPIPAPTDASERISTRSPTLEAPVTQMPASAVDPTPALGPLDTMVILAIAILPAMLLVGIVMIARVVRMRRP